MDDEKEVGSHDAMLVAQGSRLRCYWHCWTYVTVAGGDEDEAEDSPRVLVVAVVMVAAEGSLQRSVVVDLATAEIDNTLLGG